MAFLPVQEAFNSGELSKRLRGRISSSVYKHGLDYCENFAPQAQGSLLMRAGSEHKIILAGADERVRLMQFRMANGQDYLIAFLDHIIRLYSINGDAIQAEANVTQELILNGNFTLPGGVSWTGAGNSVWFNDPNTGMPLGYAHLIDSFNGGDGGKPRIYQPLVVAFNSSMQIKYDGARDGDNTGMQLRVRVSTFVPGNFSQAGDIYDAVTAIPAGTVTIDIPAIAPGNYYLSFCLQSTQGFLTVAHIDNVSAKVTYTAPQYDIPSPWSADEVRDVQLATETGADRTLFVHPAHAPYFLQYNAAAAWDFNTIVFTGAPAEWVPGNYPGVIEIHDGRAYYAATPTERNRWWGSRSGSPFDLRTATGAGGASLPGDALDYKIATKGMIRWMQGNRNLLVGTDLGEHSITGSKGTPLNGDLFVRRESAFGSCAQVQAVDAGNLALYVSGDRRKVRAIAYDLQTNGWGSKDATFVSEHITRSLIKELHHTFTPEGEIVGLLEDGKLIACTFNPEEQVLAWWRRTFSSGFVCSAAVSRGDAGAYLWIAVERNGTIYLEREPLFDGDGFKYLDASISTVVPAGGAVPTPHLADGTAVRVVLDGALDGDYVVAAGAVALDPEAEGKTAIIGIPYLAKAVTLPLDLKHAKAQNSKIGAMLNDSALPKLNGWRPADRKPGTPQGDPEARRSGKIKVGNIGTDDEAKITIEQELPFRTEILALYSVTEA
jgi:hypothetical protein